jgi:DNA-binding response OmpR family regulator
VKRIMIVEDEYFIAHDLAHGFRQRGASVIGPFATIEEAVAELSGSEPIDGVVLDINLGGKMSFPLADALKARGVPFVFLTGYERYALPEQYADIPHIEKPATMSEVVGALLS